ncbi:hypothetical protein TNCV_380271 [Trichonephila clavipes]|nr:hypothetical protein TNCV_380271 [Trichonephila clavipes]
MVGEKQLNSGKKNNSTQHSLLHLHTIAGEKQLSSATGGKQLNSAAGEKHLNSVSPVPLATVESDLLSTINQ